MSDALIWGFADLGRAAAGLAWRKGEESVGVLMIEGETSAAEVAVEGERELRLDCGDRFVVAAFRPQSESELESGASAQVGVTEVELGRRLLVCPAQISHVPERLLESSELLRHLAVPLGDDGELICTARRPGEVAEHGDERVEAVRFGPEQEREEFGEVLLSTQFDGGGRPTRIGLELWPRDEGELGPLRAAGVVIGGAESEHVLAALLETSSEGRTGIGSYLIWRR
jgi:hypothetical protein